MDTNEEITPPTKKEVTMQNQHFLFRALAAVGVVALVVVLIGLISAVFFRIRSGSSFERGYMYGGSMMHSGDYGPRGMMGGRYGVSNEQRLEGVVTVVGTDSITIAGGGKTNTVQTTSDTQYVGGTKPVVNDTVVVFGTTSGGVFTATEIAVQ